MVVSRLSQQDVREKGWLLDGYPRTSSQAQSLENMKIRPDIYILIEVCQFSSIYLIYYFVCILFTYLIFQDVLEVSKAWI